MDGKRDYDVREFREVVRDELRRRRWKVKDLAEATGIGEATLSGILTTRNPGFDKLVKILEALEVKLFVAKKGEVDKERFKKLEAELERALQAVRDGNLPADFVLGVNDEKGD
jgi:transcriptional regulator with XRE-family HTH domain